MYCNHQYKTEHYLLELLIYLFIINLPQGKEQYKRLSLYEVLPRVQTPQNNGKTTLQAVQKQ